MLYTFKEAAVCSGWKKGAVQGFLDGAVAKLGQ